MLNGVKPKPLLLNLVAGVQEVTRPAQQVCEVVHAEELGGRAAAIERLGSRVQAVLTHGVLGMTEAEMVAMPNLSLICSMGAGIENIDIAAASRRGVAVSFGPGTNAETTADHAVALICALVRNVPALDRRVRAGGWKLPTDTMPALTGRRLGVAGVGHVGEAIARRCEAGFRMPVGYVARRPRPQWHWQQFPDLTSLARWADILVIALPATPETIGSVDAAVLEALGPKSWLVNIGRGNIVDTSALYAALRDGLVAGAALDVFEHEPHVPTQLLSLDNVVLTPHVGGRSPQAEQAMARLVADNLEAHFAGRPLVTPVPAHTP